MSPASQPQQLASSSFTNSTAFHAQEQDDALSRTTGQARSRARLCSQSEPDDQSTLHDSHKSGSSRTRSASGTDPFLESSRAPSLTVSACFEAPDAPPVPSAWADELLPSLSRDE